MGGHSTKLFTAINLSISSKTPIIDYSTFAKDTHLKLKHLNSRLIKLVENEDYCEFSGKISELEDKSTENTKKLTQIWQQVAKLEENSKNQIEKLNDYSELKANTEQIKISMDQTNVKHDNQMELMKNELITLSEDIKQIHKKFDKFDEQALGFYNKNKDKNEKTKKFMIKFYELEAKYSKVHKELDNQRGSSIQLNRKYQDCHKDLATALEKIQTLEKRVSADDTPKVRKSGNMIKRFSPAKKSSKKQSPRLRLNLENISPADQLTQGRKRGRLTRAERSSLMEIEDFEIRI